MQKVSSWLALVALVLLVGCGGAVGGPNLGQGGDVTGRWAASIYVQDRQVTSFGMVLTQSGNSITGNVLAAQGTYVVEDLPITGNSDGTNITLQIGDGSESEPLIINGGVGASGRLITGTVQLEGSPVPVEFQAGRE